MTPTCRNNEGGGVACGKPSIATLTISVEGVEVDRLDPCLRHLFLLVAHNSADPSQAVDVIERVADLVARHTVASILEDEREGSSP